MKKYILITGASTGIGKAAAAKFLCEGFHVFGSVRNAADAEKLKVEFGENFTPLLFDVSNAKAIETAVGQVAKTVGNQGLACLVNNAGMSVYGPVLHVPMEEWTRQFDINVLGVLRVTQAFAPLLGAKKDSVVPPGRIINISSVSGLITRPFMGPYSASKHAVEAISDAMRRELALYGVKVIIVQPGPIKTEIWRKAAEEPVKYQDTDYAKIFRNVRKAVGGMEGIAIPVERVSDLIFKAFQAKNPKIRYFIAPKQTLFWIFTHIMPDKVMDRIFKKQFMKYWE